MRQVLRDRLTVLQGWPRRAAAVLCLLVAGAGALGGTAPDISTPSVAPLRERLPPGHVLVPVTLSGTVDFLREGDHVDLLAAPPDSSTASEVGTGLLVVRVIQPATGAFAADAATRLLVAATRPVAAKVAAVPAGQVVAVLDPHP